MIELSADEARVLGVLIEKAFTTPEQYPLTLNAVVNGSNQKNNRDLVTSMSDDAAFEALEGLKAKGLAVQVDQMGARVPKYKHRASEALHVGAAFLAVLAELMLRGPQTLGEIRGRATRMVPIESLEKAAELLRTLAEREEPYVRQLPPSPGSRAERYMQLLSPDLHPIDVPMTETTPASMATPLAATIPMTDRITALEAEVRTLRAALSKLAAAVGEADPLA